MRHTRIPLVMRTQGCNGGARVAAREAYRGRTSVLARGRDPSRREVGEALEPETLRAQVAARAKKLKAALARRQARADG